MSSFKAVIFDLGGVVFASPFEAFDAYDLKYDLAPGTVRALIRTSSETGAWAALERGELTMPDFYDRLGAEAEAAGFHLKGAVLMQMFGGGGPRPEMARAIERIRDEGLRVAALTNNWPSVDERPSDAGWVALPFDVIVESAVVGLRKPDPRIYELALEQLGVEATATVFLDDLGINLKPAREMGMTTIKVVSPHTALTELAAVLGFELT